MAATESTVAAECGWVSISRYPNEAGFILTKAVIDFNFLHIPETHRLPVQILLPFQCWTTHPGRNEAGLLSVVESLKHSYSISRSKNKIEIVPRFCIL